MSCPTARPDSIGDQPVLGPIAAANDIAGPCGGDGLALGPEEGIAVARDHDLARTLAGAVGIVAAQHIAFTVGIGSFEIVIDLVGGDHHGNARRVEAAERLQQVGGPHHVGGEGFDRLAIAGPHQRLCCHMQHDVRFGSLDQHRECCTVTNIRDMACHQSRRGGACQTGSVLYSEPGRCL